MSDILHLLVMDTLLYKQTIVNRFVSIFAKKTATRARKIGLLAVPVAVVVGILALAMSL
jgi:hypothetical protein